MKEELLKIFNELLDKWESAEYAWVNEHGILNDYDEIEKEKQEYINKFNKALERC